MKAIMDEVHASTGSLYDMSAEMYCLARSFRHTGNEHMAGILVAWANELRAMQKRLSDALGQSLADDLERGRQELADTFRAVLENISGGEREKEEQAHDPLTPAAST